jgi:hypothetical protein
MQYNLAAKEVARCSRHALATALSVLAICGVLMYLFMPVPSNLLGQYTPITTAESVDNAYKSHNLFVTYTADDYMDTGYYLVDDDDNITNHYYTFFVDNQFVICKTDKNFNQDEYTNYIVKGVLQKPRDVDQSAISQLSADLASEYGYTQAEMEAYVNPYIINTMTSPVVLTMVFSYLGILVALWAIIQLILAILHLGDYERSKSYRMMTLGGTVTPEQANEEASPDFAAGEFLIKARDGVVSHNFMLFRKPYHFILERKADLLWFYQVVTTNRVNFVPVARTYSIRFIFRDDKVCDINLRGKKATEKMLQLLTVDCPHALAGYSEELAKMRRKEPEKFEEYRAYVAQQQIEALAARQAATTTPPAVANQEPPQPTQTGQL